MSKAFESVKEIGGERCFLSSVVRPSANYLTHDSDSSVQTTLCCGMDAKRKNKMNKLMFAAAAALCATVGFADVESANIVGYQTVDAPAATRYKALTVSFESVGEVKAVPVKDLIKVANPKGGASANVAASDQIWRWNSESNDWTKYYYRQLGTQPAVGWCLNGQTKVTEETIPNGETFFFYRGQSGVATTLTLAGEVKEFSAETEIKDLVATRYRFIGYPWPVEMPIAGFEKWQGTPKGGASANVAASDQIWRWNTSDNTWTKYYYRQLGTQPAVGWCLNGQSKVTTDVIPAGEGFFFYRGQGGVTDTITFSYEEK